MAIIIKNFEINGRAFTKTYSDEYRYIVRDGISYVEANDPAEFGREYTEGDLIEVNDDDYAQVGRIIIDNKDDYSEDNLQEYIEIGKMFMGVEEDDNI